ncbi:MAG: hypothetical protein ACRCY4_02525 [Brevinema sp.]
MNVLKTAENHIVWGAANRGKTSTIRGIVKYMLKNGAEALYPSDFEVPAWDFHCILRHTNKSGVTKVYAILSAGDTKDGLQEQWDDLKNYTGKIDVVIGASRTRGATTDWWEGKFNEVNWFDSSNWYKNDHQKYTTKKIEKLKNLLNI